ncbi:hypothetical protein [Streptomyces sp. NPDC059639]
MVEPLSVVGERMHPVTGRRVVYVGCRWVEGGVFVPVLDYLTGPVLSP